MLVACPAKIPIAGKSTAVVNPVLRAGAIDASPGSTGSAAGSQLVFDGRSSGPPPREPESGVPFTICGTSNKRPDSGTYAQPASTDNARKASKSRFIAARTCAWGMVIFAAPFSAPPRSYS